MGCDHNVIYLECIDCRREGRPTALFVAMERGERLLLIGCETCKRNITGIQIHPDERVPELVLTPEQLLDDMTTAEAKLKAVLKRMESGSPKGVAEATREEPKP